MTSDVDKLALVRAAVGDFHQPIINDGLGEQHGTWSESLALTHCICFAAAFIMLDYLLEHPDDLAKLAPPRSGDAGPKPFGPGGGPIQINMPPAPIAGDGYSRAALEEAYMAGYHRGRGR